MLFHVSRFLRGLFAVQPRYWISFARPSVSSVRYCSLTVTF